MPPGRPLRVAQIAAAASHSPWFTNICSELARRRFEVVAIIDSSEGDLSGRLAANGIRLESETYTVGRNLTVAARREAFEGDAEANQMLTREYRKGFEVPSKV